MKTLKQHWLDRYQGAATEKLSWFQSQPQPSLNWIRANATLNSAVIDIGAGASVLVDHLLEENYTDISLLDLAGAALQISRQRLGLKAERVIWLTADITQWQPSRTYSLWHDRAVFHFLTSVEDREAYKRALLAGLEIGGTLIMATFALGGPQKCSGLPIVQYDAEKLQAELGDQFELLESLQEQHPTPTGNSQLFNWCLFRRIYSRVKSPNRACPTDKPMPILHI
ncbi:MAG: class I SAM-dependent methyltransferase [Xanthomonadales bacterium]|nr:class I SAM-dependent methyltransferase [Xanthomonadales bacterium]